MPARKDVSWLAKSTLWNHQNEMDDKMDDGMDDKDAPMEDLPADAPRTRPRTGKVRHRPVVLQTTTHRRPQWTYFHLALFTIAPGQAPDIITVKQHLNSATTRFLGLLGSAIPVDILHQSGSDLWLRVPRDASVAFHEAVSGWSGSGARFVTRGKSDWLASLACGSSEELFTPKPDRMSENSDLPDAAGATQGTAAS